MDTIFALSSAKGKAGIAVVRVSGPHALLSLKQLAGLSEGPAPRQAFFCSLKNPQSASIVDHALVLYFKAPHSFTGEDVVEYHLHGSPAVLDEFFSLLSNIEGHRHADHGEYTRRAFENGKLDLTKAEAIADLIDAETQAQKDQALLQMGGALTDLYEGWRERLIRVMAYVEAVIDFPDEDIPDSEVTKMIPELKSLAQDIRAHLDDNRKGERLREGIHVVILGAPNAGKSSLMNALSQRDVAIVSPMAGTTRDMIETHLNIAGYPVILTDTAGIRSLSASGDDGHEEIEGEGIRRAIARAHAADIRILLFDGTKPKDQQTQSLQNENSLLVANKMDDPGFLKDRYEGHIALSATNGQGLDLLLENLATEIKGRYAVVRQNPTLTRTRHREALQKALGFIENGLAVTAPELMAEETRMAARELGRITGRVDVEDLLDVIFRDFCIGK